MAEASGVAQFDNRAHGYHRGWRGEFHARVVVGSAELVAEHASGSVALLDVGCGTGALLRELSDRLPADARLVGVDPAPSMIEVASDALGGDGRVELRQGFAERLPFASDGFDVVVSTVSFHHWADQQAGTGEVARVLRPGGTFVLVDHFATGWLRAFNAVARRRMRTVDEVEAMLRASGLAPAGWSRVYDLGPLALIRAVTANAQRESETPAAPSAS